MRDLSVIVPCYNEEDNVEPLAQSLSAVFNRKAIAGEIVFINDASTDSTGQKLNELAHEHDCVQVYHHESNKGITESWATGLAHSLGRYVVTIDADLQYDPNDIAVLYEVIVRNNYDLVQGWRKEYYDKAHRKLLSRGLSFLLSTIFAIKLKDIKSGFVIYRKEVLERILADRIYFKTFQHFFLIAASVYGYSITQIPITFKQRQFGTSFITNPVMFSWDVLCDLPQALWRYKFRKIKK